MNKYLAVVLDPESHLYLRELALYSEVRAHHVTLAYPDDQVIFAESWLPLGTALGDEVLVVGRGFSITEDVQALVVAISGSTTRPFDGGILHITVSKQPGIPSTQSNQVIAEVNLVPFDKTFKGKIGWLQKANSESL